MIAAITFFFWVAAALVLVLFSELPIASLLSLAVLVAGFEAVHALHVGVERIGRYVQVFYEEASDGPGAQPRWETTAMQVGPALPGGGVDPLFSALFLCAAVINLVPMLLPAPESIEIGVIAVLHATFVIRVIRSRMAAAKQRATELEQYRALRARSLPNLQSPIRSSQSQESQSQETKA